MEADVRALFDTGVFEDVVAVLEERDGQPATLVFEVRERPRFARLEVVGAPPGFDAGAALGERSPHVDPRWVRGAARRLREALRSEGFRHAEVEHEVKSPAEGEADVRFVVEAGARFRLGSIRFEGLQKAPEGLLRKDLGATPGEAASEELLERDALVVNAALYEVGLVESRVTRRVEENRLASTFDVVFTVTEGPVYSLHRVRVTGAGALAAPRYAAILGPLPRGSVFVRSKIVAAKQAIEELHQAAGAARTIDVSTRLDAAKRTVDLDFLVQ